MHAQTIVFQFIVLSVCTLTPCIIDFVLTEHAHHHLFQITGQLPITHTVDSPEKGSVTKISIIVRISLLLLTVTLRKPHWELEEVLAERTGSIGNAFCLCIYSNSLEVPTRQ